MFASFVVIAGLSLAACGDDDDGGPDDENTTSPTTSAGRSPTLTGIPSVTPTGGGSPTQTASRVVGRYPRDFPADFPVYPNGEITRGDDFIDRFIVDLVSTDTRDTVSAFFEEQLAAGSWVTDNVETTEADITIIDFHHSEGTYTGKLYVAPLPDDETRVLIQVEVAAE